MQFQFNFNFLNRLNVNQTQRGLDLKKGVNKFLKNVSCHKRIQNLFLGGTKF